MRTHPSPRWLALALLAALLAAGLRPAFAAPSRLQTFTISVVAYVDVTPVVDQNCPGCNGVFDPEDRDYALTNPLGTMDFVVKDSTGAEVGRQTSAELDTGIQNTVFTVDQGPEFTVDLVAPPSGWQLCQSESASRTLKEEDFGIGGTAELQYHFTQGCTLQETPTPEGPTPEPGTATAVPATPVVPVPTEKHETSGSAAAAAPALGYIKGFACIDRNGNGKVDSDDPGLNDVRVKVSGGSTTLYTVTPGTGAYSFDGLGAGTYEVSISVGPEWRVTTPTMYTVKLAPGQVAMGNDFCMVRVGEPVPAAAKLMAGRGVRLPATGFADLPASSLLGMATLLLGALGALGFAAERRRGGLRDE
jgi:hypothetical protein